MNGSAGRSWLSLPIQVLLHLAYRPQTEQTLKVVYICVYIVGAIVPGNKNNDTSFLPDTYPEPIGAGNLRRE